MLDMGFNENIGKARMKDDYPGNKSDSINQESDEQFNASQDMSSLKEKSDEDGRFNLSCF